MLSARDPQRTSQARPGRGRFNLIVGADFADFLRIDRICAQY
jgi:hypothetical protein